MCDPLPPAVLELLRTLNSGPLIEDCREKFWERAAICEFDGQLSRESAEELAFRELKSRLGAGEQGSLF